MNIETIKKEVNAEKGLNDFMNDHSIILNYYLVKNLGIDAALMFGALYNDYYYNKRKQRFSTSVNMIKNFTGLSAERQRKAIKTLEDAGLIKYELGFSGYHKRQRRFSIVFDIAKFENIKNKCLGIGVEPVFDTELEKQLYYYYLDC